MYEMSTGYMTCQYPFIGYNIGKCKRPQLSQTYFVCAVPHRRQYLIAQKIKTPMYCKAYQFSGCTHKNYTCPCAADIAFVDHQKYCNGLYTQVTLLILEGNASNDVGST